MREHIESDFFFFLGWGGRGCWGAPESWPCYFCSVFLEIISHRNFHLHSPPHNQNLKSSIVRLSISIATVNDPINCDTLTKWHEKQNLLSRFMIHSYIHMCGFSLMFAPSHSFLIELIVIVVMINACSRK